MPDPDRSPASPSHRPWARGLLWLGLLLIVGVAAWWFLLRPPQTPPPMPNQWRGPVAVRVEAARTEDFTVQARAVGTVAPYNTVVVRSRVAGQLARVLVREGQRVTRGQLLAEIDPEPLRVALAQAQGQQQQNLAQLRNAESELARYEQLFTRDAIARQQLDRQAALVQQLRGTLKADQAQVDNAKLQLSYTRIEAPIAGRVGLRRVDAGNLIGANDAEGLFTLTQTQPVAVLFSVPEPQVADVRAAHAEKTPPVVEAWDRDNRTRLATGRLDTLDNQIDAATATLRLKARFENADDALFPNQFVNVRLALRQLPGAVTIPTDAVQHGSRGSYVYVIVDNKARVRDLTLGPASGGRTVVLKGLAAGEPVVLEGLDRLEDGRAVNVVQATELPANSPLAPDAAAPR
ncbi:MULTISPECIES: efflux RND transporter periplasmic adaptor subunit [Hydrogenophaga]|uniref:HlyD family secretion protein n=1 Tax=Hydrogenophaga intermedia TaxID=65786 RepID=A0A1L1Q075_HYDIT|nr:MULTISPECIES: efflux RND transporter periplasmic adaptor subunit [Hydrogenophaga]AOS81076.1 multidrug transporter subunit MdtA [Hydrogenophaga sp. PBC]TMU71421.1 efflux RND transporter periplasmic adaptor subunit [Hydrogenophaga intermedia]CDN90241.1 HlyD family secretion protein [Hydrogenophaga intermedia]